MKMRLIDADNVYKRLHEIGGCHATDEWAKGYDGAIDTAIELLDDIPTIEAEPVKHGRWHNVFHTTDGKTLFVGRFCSECDGYTLPGHKFKYCPYCGAKMDGGNENET